MTDFEREQVEAAFAAGEHARGLDLLIECRPGDAAAPEQRAVWKFLAARYCTSVQRDYEKGRRYLRKALTEATSIELRAQVLGALVHASRMSSAITETRHYARQYLALKGYQDTAAACYLRFRVLWDLALAEAAVHDDEQALICYREALATLESADCAGAEQAALVACCRARIGWHLGEMGLVAKAQEQITAAWPDVPPDRRTVVAAWAALLSHGQEAQAWVQQAEAAVAESGNRISAGAWCNLARLHMALLTGVRDAAGQFLRDAQNLAVRAGCVWECHVVQRYAARLAGQSAAAPYGGEPGLL